MTDSEYYATRRCYEVWYETYGSAKKLVEGFSSSELWQLAAGCVREGLNAEHTFSDKLFVLELLAPGFFIFAIVALFIHLYARENR